MCGICGILNFDTKGRIVPELLEAMRDTMVHRGPDDAGLYVNGNIGFGHRRLSVIDLTGGHQPMCNQAGTLWIVYNGEIYNYQELKYGLIQRGHVFKTNSDTETIIHLYEEYGVQSLQKLNGMFAFALWDEQRQMLFMARDRFGVKPLYYAVTRRSLVFASEMKAILAVEKGFRTINENILYEFLLFRHTAGEETLFRGIYSLEPGHYLICQDGKLTRRAYWAFQYDRQSNAGDKYTACMGFKDLLEDSIEKRLISDVPLGTFNSGGVDSSLVTAIAARKSNQSLKTFSVGFSETGYDETSYAKLVSHLFGTEHHIITVGARKYTDMLPKMVWHLDEPMNHPNSVALYLVSKLAKEFVTVILTGEGADEIFGGYPRYFIPRLSTIIESLPMGARSLIRNLGCFGAYGKLAKLSAASGLDQLEKCLFNSSVNSPHLVSQILDRRISNDDPEKRIAFLRDDGMSGRCIEEQLMLLDVRTYLVSVLNRQDKMSMAASIEAREPFLDYRIGELSMALPLHMKLHRFQTKYIVKKVAEDYLPRRIVYRRKSGFSVPISSWLRDGRTLGRYLDLLSDTRFTQRGLFKPDRVQRLVEDHKKGREDYGEMLWTLINCELWFQTFIDS